MTIKRYRQQIDSQTEANVYVTSADNVDPTEVIPAPAANQKLMLQVYLYGAVDV